MTIKEAILKSLDDLVQPTDSTTLCDHILQHNYYEFSGKTPAATISAQLGEFIRNGDSRIKRYKTQGRTYLYYLAKHKAQINLDGTEKITASLSNKVTKPSAAKYEERDLHKLLSTYLNSSSTYAKTIFHEQSNGRDSNQIWTHPDMVVV